MESPSLLLSHHQSSLLRANSYFSCIINPSPILELAAICREVAHYVKPMKICVSALVDELLGDKRQTPIAGGAWVAITLRIHPAHDGFFPNPIEQCAAMQV
mmetsp:Transcript_27612/g.84094  ORF Transcript_27612/g.84094 Transcript_27612/m.84094 type:complete len:101 (+) Transcript_27612:546-848(+)